MAWRNVTRGQEQVKNPMPLKDFTEICDPKGACCSSTGSENCGFTVARDIRTLSNEYKSVVRFWIFAVKLANDCEGMNTSIFARKYVSDSCRMIWFLCWWVLVTMVTFVNGSSQTRQDCGFEVPKALKTSEFHWNCTNFTEYISANLMNVRFWLFFRNQSHHQLVSATGGVSWRRWSQREWFSVLDSESL